nr:MAG TPA: hypothetical protein [Caudoviricetes sp.]
MRVYHIYRDGIQQDCRWLRYRDYANKRLRGHCWRKLKIDWRDHIKVS